jgi:hypothetical protein
MTPSPKERIPSLVYDTSSTAAAGTIITLENPAMVESVVVSTAHLNSKNKSMMMMNSSIAAATTATGGKQATVPVTEQNQLRVRDGFLLFVSKKLLRRNSHFHSFSCHFLICYPLRVSIFL